LIESGTNIHAKRRVLAEKQWLECYEMMDLPIHIFRLSGIYGPERDILTKLQNGTARAIHFIN